MKPNKTMMHGSDYAGQDPTNWLVTEKFDGFFARWTGQTLLTREGVDFNAPAWFTSGLPRFALDCELFAGYGKRETLNAAPRWKDKDRWNGLKLIAFDAPGLSGNYRSRHSEMDCAVHDTIHHQLTLCWTCLSKGAMLDNLCAVTARGGEGLVIRQPAAPYTIGRVSTMLKVKPEFVQP